LVKAAEAKVCNLQINIFLVTGNYEDILWLKISMDLTVAMHVVDPSQYLVGNICCFVFTEGLNLFHSFE
jgi:hypothetical protein